MNDTIFKPKNMDHYIIYNNTYNKYKNNQKIIFIAPWCFSK